MCIQVINLDGTTIIEGIQLIELYRTPLLRKTVEHYAHLIDGTAPLDLEQLADRVQKSGNSLRTMTNAYYLRKLHAETSHPVASIAA